MSFWPTWFDQCWSCLRADTAIDPTPTVDIPLHVPVLSAYNTGGNDEILWWLL